jgi:cyanophycin synthetase
MEQLVVFGTYTDMYRAHINGEWFYFESLPVPPSLEQSGYEWMSDKLLLKEALQEAGIPVPRAYSVTNVAAAVAALQSERGGFVIAKPQAGSRGRHTTTFISTEADMVEAFVSAQMLCAYVVVEQHLQGGVSRATVVDGKLVGFFTAHPPRVTGDGVSTIRELLAIKNKMKHERVSSVVLDGEHEATLRRLGFHPDSILALGVTIDLTHRTGRLFGGETRELRDSVHAKLRTYVERAAHVLDVPVVGFDLIIPDPESDPDSQEWGIIEANGLPFIDLHYLPLYGTPSNTAAPVWDLWKKYV